MTWKLVHDGETLVAIEYIVFYQIENTFWDGQCFTQKQKRQK
jgi:hypothetical protein